MLPRLDRQNSTTDGRQREWMLHSAWVHMSADEGTVTKLDTKGPSRNNCAVLDADASSTPSTAHLFRDGP